jgi:hypothetical protein
MPDVVGVAHRFSGSVLRFAGRGSGARRRPPVKRVALGGPSCGGERRAQEVALHGAQMRPHGGLGTVEVALGDRGDDAVVLGEAVVVRRRPANVAPAQNALDDRATHAVERVEQRRQQAVVRRDRHRPVQLVGGGLVPAPARRRARALEAAPQRYRGKSPVEPRRRGFPAADPR